MAAIHGMDRNIGLDLILHTPGGDLAATESLIEYLWTMFPGPDIRVIIPQMAMSGGTLLALASKEIIMGAHSSIGPVDPQFGEVSAANVVTEFERAKQDIVADPNLAGLWGPILQRYGPTLLTVSEHAVKWADDIAKHLLTNGMFKDLDETERQARIEKVIGQLGRPAESKSHNRHIGIGLATEIGLMTVSLEDHQDLQDAVLSLHHAFMISMPASLTVKIVQNHKGVTVLDSNVANTID